MRFVLPAILFLASQCVATDVIMGPVSSLLDSLAYNTAAIAGEMTLQLNRQIDRISNTLIGQVEVIIASAMDELSEPVFVAKEKLAAETCLAIWTIDDLRDRIDTELANCTQELSDLLESFRVDADASAKVVQQQANEILQLPADCQMAQSKAAATGEVSFSSSTSCFVEKIANINRIVAQELNRVSMAFVHTRELARLSARNAEQCSSDLVAEVVAYLDESLEHC